MSADQFYLGAVVFFFATIGFLIYRNNGPNPVRLRMLSRKAPPKKADLSPTAAARSEKPQQRNLSVLFNYNGHTWEAYEVLGCPAGSSYEVARTALREISKRTDKESAEFFEAALEAIRSAEVGNRSTR